MRTNPISSFPLLILFITFVAGCSAEYNKDEAANRAREYLFEKIPKISPQNAAYVKYTYPKLLISPIYSTNMPSEKELYWNWGYSYYDPVTFSRSRQYSQTAFTWDLPDPKVSVMVIGTSYDNYQGWQPIRLILRPTDDGCDTIRSFDKPETIKPHITRNNYYE